ncbi:MAG: type II toxin-antitoxin system RelE/ParE family toxin [Microcystaceae cyanobacterium]
MKANYLPTFVKDIKALKSSPYYSTIKKVVFEEILTYQQLNEMVNVKKLKGEDNAYRIRIGDYSAIALVGWVNAM